MSHNQNEYVAVLMSLIIAGVIAIMPGQANAGTYSIHEIQCTTDPSGRSPLEGRVIDCRGGIVTNKFEGGKPKLTIQDPNHPFGWGAIQVRDGLPGAPLFHQASVGDRIVLFNVRVEEFFGNTTLQCLAVNAPSLVILSQNNTLPEPLEVTPAQIAAPIGNTLGDWQVTDHSAEKYEHMRLKVGRVAVDAKDLGKAADNYALLSLSDPNEPPATCWASDYMNADRAGGYHPHVSPGQEFCHVEGILEQFTNTLAGWDYYQLVTTATQDFLILQTADLDRDCDVDFDDFASMAVQWLVECATGPQGCDCADLDGDRLVGQMDLAGLAEHWLEGIPRTMLNLP